MESITPPVEFPCHHTVNIPAPDWEAMIERAAATMCFWGVMDQPHPACEPHREQAEAMLRAALEC